MATFTLRLEQAYKAHGGNATLERGRWKLDKPEILGLGYYPIYEESYREVLNGLIFDHYQNQEIGLETVTMFAGAVRSKMNQIMPFYNELYLSKLIEFDPMVTTNLRNTVSSLMEQAGETVTNESTLSSGESSSTTNSVTDNSAKSRAVASTTPQGMLKGAGDYASSAQDNVSSSDGTTEGEATSSEHQTGASEATGSSEATVASDSDALSFGYQGVPGDLINAARNAIINVDMMIIAELEEFFMMVWNTTDQYTPRVF